MNSSYKGKILISTPDISGDIFSRSVVLIIDHNEDGAFGLILNRKNPDISLQIEQTTLLKTDIYEGGPIENQKIFVIAKGKPVSDFYMEISDDYYITEDLQSVITALMENRITDQDIKVFSGYSGWAAHQLESEIERKMWTVADAYHLDYTLPNDQSLWKKIMQNLGGEFLLWANAPKDISMN